MEKLKYPIIVLLARDWNLYKDQYPVDEKFEVSVGWISGFLVKETDDTYVISAEYFADEETVRYTQAIPKETVTFHRVFWIDEKK